MSNTIGTLEIVDLSTGDIVSSYNNLELENGMYILDRFMEKRDLSADEFESMFEYRFVDGNGEILSSSTKADDYTTSFDDDDEFESALQDMDDYESGFDEDETFEDEDDLSGNFESKRPATESFNNINSENVYDKLEELEEILGKEKVFEALYKGLSTDDVILVTQGMCQDYDIERSERLNGDNVYDKLFELEELLGLDEVYLSFIKGTGKDSLINLIPEIVKDYFKNFESKRPSKKSDVKIAGTNLIIVGFGNDTNGNRVIKLKNTEKGNSFSIQTNGKLPKTHRNSRGFNPNDIDPDTLNDISKEVTEYIKNHGTDKQKELLK